MWLMVYFYEILQSKQRIYYVDKDLLLPVNVTNGIYLYVSFVSL